jgi:nucleoside transporter
MTPARVRLSAMMFLELFIWGAWLPLIFGYLDGLGFDTAQKWWTLSAFNIAAFTALFFSTQFADRNFAAEKFVALSHLVGGVSILALYWTRSFWPFFLGMLVHSLFYVPTISITNSIAFANLKDPQKEFGPVRMWGAIGWVAASWPFVFLLADRSGAELQAAKASMFLVAGAASLLLAALSLSLPHTPPRKAGAGVERFAWLEAFKLLRVPFVLVLFVVTFFDAGVHQGYFVLTDTFLTKGVGIAPNWVMPVMALGQIAEIGTMAVVGAALRRLGWRKTMTLGILGHALRFAVFALLPIKELVVASILLHGICYAFFFATVYIFIDEFFPKDARSTAQGLFNFLILGLGPIAGNYAWPEILAGVTTEAGTDFRALFLVPSMTALAAAGLLFLFFRPPEKAAPEIRPAPASN